MSLIFTNYPESSDSVLESGKKTKTKEDKEIKKLKKDNAISEDEEKRFENEVQKLTDEAIKKIDELFAQKEKDILQV